MKQLAYNLLGVLANFFFKGHIVGKKINGYDKKLYYEKSQHLTFLFQSEIKYEDLIQEKIKHYLKKGDVVFDIGGNIGQYAIPFSEMVGNEGRVVSFEPDYKNFSFLQFNVNINRCKNVTCNNYGIGNEDTILEFFRDTETGGRRGSFKKEYVDNFKGFSDKVRLKKFDTLISEFGEPNFVKIDVEGFETDVISALTIPLNNTTFLIEVREETKKGIFDFFSKRNYQCTWIDGTDVLITNSNQIPEFANLIFRK